HHKNLVQLVIDFDKLDEYANAINGHALFCCLGSTRKKTPDLSIYRKIDYGYPLKLAEIAKQNGMRHYHLVSSLGANAKSLNFYTKIKGEVEDAIKQTGIKCIHIYEPAILTGDRKESRPMDRFIIAAMNIIDPLLVGRLKKYRNIPAQTVAMAMYKQSLKTEEGIFVRPSDKIKLLA
ncbi:MAG: nucleoside-diphosphate sugar epimerase, partial [Mucilaginibacter sp.]